MLACFTQYQCGPQKHAAWADWSLSFSISRPEKVKPLVSQAFLTFSLPQLAFFPRLTSSFLQFHSPTNLCPSSSICAVAGLQQFTSCCIKTSSFRLEHCHDVFDRRQLGRCRKHDHNRHRLWYHLFRGRFYLVQQDRAHRSGCKLGFGFALLIGRGKDAHRHLIWPKTDQLGLLDSSQCGSGKMAQAPTH
ncbi:hypothetical protein VTK56DRAFT_4294 [Thermocarpiscus australiensis]